MNRPRRSSASNSAHEIAGASRDNPHHAGHRGCPWVGSPPPSYRIDPSFDLSAGNEQGSQQQGSHLPHKQYFLAKEEYYASWPFKQLQAQARDEEVRMRQQIKDGTAHYPIALELRIIALEKVKNRWIDVGIWNEKWSQDSCDSWKRWKWKHEDPCEAKLESEPEPQLPQIDRFKHHFFRKGTEARRESRQDKALNQAKTKRALLVREREASRPINMFNMQVATRREWIEERLKVPSAPPINLADINTMAYNEVKAAWIEQKIWNEKWTVLPGMKWKHEEQTWAEKVRESVHDSEEIERQHRTLCIPAGVSMSQAPYGNNLSDDNSSDEASQEIEQLLEENTRQPLDAPKLRRLHLLERTQFQPSLASQRRLSRTCREQVAQAFRDPLGRSQQPLIQQLRKAHAQKRLRREDLAILHRVELFEAQRRDFQSTASQSQSMTHRVTSETQSTHSFGSSFFDQRYVLIPEEGEMVERGEGREPEQASNESYLSAIEEQPDTEQPFIRTAPNNNDNTTSDTFNIPHIFDIFPPLITPLQPSPPPLPRTTPAQPRRTTRTRTLTSHPLPGQAPPPPPPLRRSRRLQETNSTVTTRAQQRRMAVQQEMESRRQTRAATAAAALRGRSRRSGSVSSEGTLGR